MQIETGVFFCRDKFHGQAVRSEEPVAEWRIREIGVRDPAPAGLRAEQTPVGSMDSGDIVPTGRR